MKELLPCCSPLASGGLFFSVISIEATVKFKRRFLNSPEVSRRRALQQLGDGIGIAALAAMVGDSSALAAENRVPTTTILPHHPATATSVIQIFCPGGLSHVDTWDYRPQLEKSHGTSFDAELGKQTFAGIGGEYARSFWRFRQHGESGRWLSDLFPLMSQHVDDIAFIYSMQNKSALHGPAMFMMNSGYIRPGFPSMGSWVTYGLGCETDNLPSFVVLPDMRGLPPGGVLNWGAGFLPAMHQGTVIETAVDKDPIANLFPPGGQRPDEQPEREFLQMLNRRHAEERSEDTLLEARIASYELAAKLQLSAPGGGGPFKGASVDSRTVCPEGRRHRAVWTTVFTRSADGGTGSSVCADLLRSGEYQLEKDSSELGFSRRHCS